MRNCLTALTLSIVCGIAAPVAAAVTVAMAPVDGLAADARHRLPSAPPIVKADTLAPPSLTLPRDSFPSEESYGRYREGVRQLREVQHSVRSGSAGNDEREDNRLAGALVGSGMLLGISGLVVLGTEPNTEPSDGVEGLATDIGAGCAHALLGLSLIGAGIATFVAGLFV